MRPSTPANNRRGATLWELLFVFACLEILWAASAATIERLAASASNLETHTQAVLAAEGVLEVRRATGRFPAASELDRLLSTLGRARRPRLSTREERFRGTGLSKVTVAVAWQAAGPGASEREVRLVSLARTTRP